jgi:LPS O-antigen subunit length determinant protein (WzzB/FepE family)
MEEFDSHTEHAQEQAHEAAHESRESWVMGVALTAAILAALAAVTSLLSGHHEHEAMVEQLQASDKWSYYQAKGIKAAILEQRIENEVFNGRQTPIKQTDKLKEYKKEQENISAEANEKQESSRLHDRVHVTFAGGVTLFQVAIAVAAISALTRRRVFWFVGIALGVVAIGFLASGLITWSASLAHHA